MTWRSWLPRARGRVGGAGQLASGDSSRRQLQSVQGRHAGGHQVSAHLRHRQPRLQVQDFRGEPVPSVPDRRRRRVQLQGEGRRRSHRDRRLSRPNSASTRARASTSRRAAPACSSRAGSTTCSPPAATPPSSPSRSAYASAALTFDTVHPAASPSRGGRCVSVTVVTEPEGPRRYFGPSPGDRKSSELG